MKGLSITAVILICLGAVLLLCSAASVNFDLSEIIGEQDIVYFEREYETDIKRIIIDDSDADITVTSSGESSEMIKVSAEHYENSEYTSGKYDVNDEDILYIKKTHHRDWYDYILNIKLTRQHITVEIPAGADIAVEVIGSEGYVYIDTLSAPEVVARTEKGAVNANFSDIEGDMTLISTDGGVSSYRSVVGGKLDMYSEMDGVFCTDTKAGDIKITSDHGTARLYKSESEKDTIISSRFHDVYVELPDFGGALDISAPNGSVDGYLLGTKDDYTFDIDAVFYNGLKNYADVEKGEKPLCITAGYVYLEFEQKYREDYSEETYDEDGVPTSAESEATEPVAELDEVTETDSDTSPETVDRDNTPIPDTEESETDETDPEETITDIVRLISPEILPFQILMPAFRLLP